MRKIGILLLIMMAALSAKAQIYTGGTLNIFGGDGAFNFMLKPEVGYEFNEKWAFGGVLSLEHSKIKGGGIHNGMVYEGNGKVNSFAIAPYARYTFFENDLLRIFADGGFGVGVNSVKDGDNTAGFEVGVKPGIAIKLGDHFSILTKVGFLGYRDDFMGYTNGGGLRLSSEDVSFGFYYAF